MEREGSCIKCKYHSADIGNKGYCTLYRHNIASPDVACPKFEKKEAKEHKISPTAEKFGNPSSAEPPKRKHQANKMLLALSIACTAVVSILLLIFSATLCVAIATINEVKVLDRAIAVILVAAFVISLIVIICMLLSKFRVMRFIIPLISLLAIIILLAFSNEVWFDFHSLIMNLVQTIFNISL